MSTKCQYRPDSSTGVYHSGENRFLCAIQVMTPRSDAPDDHVQRVEAGQREVQRQKDLDLRGVRAFEVRSWGPECG